MLRRSWILICAFMMFANLSSREYLYEDLQSELKNLKADESKVANIKDLFWQKENGMFSLDSGKMYFMQPINNRISCAIFIGKGSFAFSPPTKVEKIQLERLLKTQFFNTEVEAMVMFFTDSTYEFIKNNFAITTGEIPDKVRDLYERARKYLINSKNNEIDFPLTRALLNSYPTNYSISFLWNIEWRLDDFPYIFLIDPLDEEEIKFMKGDWRAGSVGYYINQICEFSNSKGPKKDEAISIEKYTINLKDTNKYIVENITHINVPGSLEEVLMEVILNRSKGIYAVGQDNDSIKNKYGPKIFETKIKFKALKDTVYWIDFKMRTKIKLDSILDENKNILNYRLYNDKELLIIDLKDPMLKNEYQEITFYYKTFGLGLYNWFPYHKSEKKAFYDITYFLNKSINFENLYENAIISDSEDFKIYKFESKNEIFKPLLLPGNFEKVKIKSNITKSNFIFYHKNVANAEEIIKFCTELLNFFSQLFGVYTNDDIVIKIENEQSFTIIPDLQYYSIIFLGNNLNIGKSLSAIWWGEKLKNYSKEDKWLIGSLQTYSGYLLTQIGMNDSNEIFIQLNKSKNELIRANEKVDTEETPPVIIAYGEINNNNFVIGDFENIIYNKGVWVLHMLRNLFIDFDTMDDKLFFDMLKEFFETHKDSYATTQDFVNIVSKYAGADMRWFFEQWIESNEMPTYTFGYKKEKTPEGKYKVTARIKQTGVNEKFMMPVPVNIDYGDSYRILRINVTKPFIEFEFPLFDVEPKKFQLNAYESVLCEVEYDDFEDIEP